MYVLYSTIIISRMVHWIVWRRTARLDPMRSNVTFVLSGTNNCNTIIIIAYRTCLLGICPTLYNSIMIMYIHIYNYEFPVHFLFKISLFPIYKYIKYYTVTTRYIIVHWVYREVIIIARIYLYIHTAHARGSLHDVIIFSEDLRVILIYKLYD